MARFVITDPQQRTQIFEISTPNLSIGRADSNDLVLDDNSVSRHHARVSVTGIDTALLVDLGSLNGTFVNGHQVEEHRLADQDQISIGAFELSYELPAEPPLQVEAGSQMAEDVAELLSEEGLDVAAAQKAKEKQLWGTAKKLPEAVLARIGELEKQTHQLRLLLAVGNTLSSVLLPQEIMRRVMDLVFQIENVERGFIMLRDEKGGFKPALVVYKDERLKDDRVKADASTVVLSKKLIERVTSERLPLLVRNVGKDERFADSESLKLSGVRSAMCAPLNYKDAFFGIFYVDCLSKTLAFTTDELGIFAVIAAQAAIGLDNARSHEELARHALERSALQRFLSPAVVARILSDPNQIRLGGETQTATILFADIRNFTRLAERREPQEVVQLLNDFFSEMTEIIFENGGTLDKYLGDGLMALFGAPIPRPDDALRAAKTAIDMKRSLARVKHHWQVPGARDLRIGIGINTGKVTAGNIGSTQRMDYTVIGDAVNVASRLCASAAGGQILVSESTYKQLSSDFPTRQHEPILVKGREGAIEVYEILWEPAQD